MGPSCAGCEVPTEGALCEHLVDGRWSPFERRGLDVARCVDCGSDDGADRPVCVACQASVLGRHVLASAADLARGWALLPRPALEAGEERAPDPRPRVAALRPGGYAKVVVVSPARVERLWARIETRDGDALEGRIANDPELFPLRLDERIAFRVDHVVQASHDPGLPRVPPGHSCALCDETVRRQTLDDGDRKLLSDVRRVGWHLCMVREGDRAPAFAFTVGLTHTHRHPELVVVGLDQHVAEDLLNELGRRVAAGEALGPGPVEGLLEDRRARLVRFADAHHAEWLGYMRWFYRSPHPAALQLQWSDADGAFCTSELQPDLGQV